MKDPEITKANKRTLHIHTLFLSKGGAKVLDLCCETALNILGCKSFSMGLSGRLGRWKGMCWETNLLD